MSSLKLDPGTLAVESFGTVDDPEEPVTDPGGCICFAPPCICTAGPDCTCPPPAA